MARIRSIKPEFWDSPSLNNIKYENLGVFDVKPVGAGRWLDFPRSSAEPLEYVYFIYSLQNELLYVGKTEDAYRRIRRHARKLWFNDADYIAIYSIHGDSRAESEFNTFEVERVAIESLEPTFNQKPGTIPRVSKYCIDPYGMTQKDGEGVSHAHQIH